MIDDGELSKIEDMILISGNLTEELKNRLDGYNQNIVISNQNYMNSKNDYEKTSYENESGNNLSDMADLQSVMLTAASGTQMLSNIRKSSPNEFNNPVIFLKPKTPGNQLNKSVNLDSNSSIISETDMATNSISGQITQKDPSTACKVCGDTSSGIHYGVLTCEGCKGFFSRALRENSHRKMCCTKNRRCSVMLGTRNHCQYCRLKKCLKLGMSRDSARIGRRRSDKRLSMTVVEEEDPREDIDEYEDVTIIDVDDDDDTIDESQLDDEVIYAESRESRLARSRQMAKQNKKNFATDLENEIEKARAKSKVLMSKRKKPDIKTKNHEVASSSHSNVSLTEGSTQDEPDSTLKPDIPPNFDLTPYINATGDLYHKTNKSLLGSKETNPSVMSFIDQKWQSANKAADPVLSPMLASRTPIKKTTFPSTDYSKAETTNSGATFYSIQASPKTPSTTLSVSSNSSYTNVPLSGNQLHHALGLSHGVNNNHQLTVAIETAFKDIFKNQIDAGDKYSHDQINNLNENALNLLFGDQNWKVRSTVHINPTIQSITWDGFHQRFNEIVQNVVKFVKKIPGFSELDTDDRINLVRSGCFEAGCIIHSYYINQINDAWIGARDFVLIRSQMKLVMPLDETFIDQLFDYSIRFKQFRLSHTETGLLCAVMLINPERPGLINKDKVSRLQDDLTQALQQQVFANHGNGMSLLPKVLISTSSLRELSLEHRQQLNNLKGRFTFPNDLYAETFDLT